MKLYKLKPRPSILTVCEFIFCKKNSISLLKHVLSICCSSTVDALCRNYTWYILLLTFSREGSPVRDGIAAGLSATLPQRVAPLTTEAVNRLQVRTFSHTLEGGGPYNYLTLSFLQSFKDGVGNHDDDDAESVTSECSTFSISSEVSVSPYVRYPHPVTVSALSEM